MTTRHLCGWTRKTTPEKRRSFYSGTILDSKNLSLAPKIKVWVWIFPLKISFLTRIKKIHWDNLFVSPWLNFWWWKLHPKYFELKWESALDRIQFHHGEPRKKMVFASHAFFASAPLQMNPNILGFFERKNVKLCFKNTGIFASIVAKNFYEMNANYLNFV